MDRHQKLMRHILMRQGDANVPFASLCRLLLRLGFHERVKGDHHIFSSPDLAEIVNLQPKGTAAKTYQVRQIRELILRYSIKLEE